MNIKNYNRIILVGSGGSGKSWLADELGKLTGFPVIHLDKEFWQPGWVETPRSEWTEKQKGFISGTRWIIDGNYGGTMELRFDAADLVIFLDIGRFVCIGSVFKRWITNIGRTRPDMGNCCPEAIDFEFLKWIWGYPRNGKLKVLALHDKYPDKKFIVLNSRKQVGKLLSELGCNKYAKT